MQFRAATTGGFGAPAAGFGAPGAAPGFGAAPAAAPGFGAPGAAPGFGAPGAAPGFGAPAAAPGFGAPAAAPGFGAPAAAPGFGAPAAAPGFGAPGAAPGFGAPAGAPGFGAPAAAPGFGGAPAPAVGAAPTAGFSDTALQNPPTDCISSVCFTPPGSSKVVVAATSWDKTVRCWELMSGAGGIQQQPIAMLNHSHPILTSALTADFRLFYGGCCNNVMMASLGQPTPQQVGAHTQPVSSVRWLAQHNSLLTTGWDGKMHLWDTRSPTPVKSEDFGAPIVSVCTRAPNVISVLLSRKIVFIDIASWQKKEEQPNQFMKFQLREISTNDHGTGAYVAGVDGRIAYHPITAQGGTGYCHKAHSVDKTTPKVTELYQVNCINVCRGSVVTGGGDGKIIIWSTDKNRIKEYMGPANGVPISCGAIGAEGALYAYGASYDWSAGKEGYNPQGPFGVFVKTFKAGEIKP
jgi:mRNA export factor